MYAKFTACFSLQCTSFSCVQIKICKRFIHDGSKKFNPDHKFLKLSSSFRTGAWKGIGTFTNWNINDHNKIWKYIAKLIQETKRFENPLQIGRCRLAINFHWCRWKIFFKPISDPLYYRDWKFTNLISCKFCKVMSILPSTYEGLGFLRFSKFQALVKIVAYKT